MSWRSWIAVVLLAASCAAPQPPEAWSVERVTPEVEETPDVSICDEIRDFALRSQVDLTASIDELARIGAVTGASGALPALNNIQALALDTTISDADRAVTQHDLFVAASLSIDNATAAACEVPAFSAMYAASGFASCHFEIDIPIAAYTAVNPGKCRTDGPTFLPCWSNDGNHLAVDCVTKLIVQADGDRWVPAGEPRDVVIERGSATPQPSVVTATGAAACRGLESLFTEDTQPNGGSREFDDLITAVATLGNETQELVDDFIAANTTTLSLDEFETIVATLDRVTADACGLPIVSAWVTITEPVDSLPCWSATDAAYPAYETADCPT